MKINFDGVQYDYDEKNQNLGSVLMVFKVDEKGLGIETRFNGSLDMMKGAVQALERQIEELEAGLMPKIAVIHGGVGEDFPDFLEELMKHLTGGGCNCGDAGCNCGDDTEDEPGGGYEENDEQADAAAVAAGIREAFNKTSEPPIFKSDIIQ